MNRRVLPLIFLVSLLSAHPMGNFSVSHYSRIQPNARGAAIRYVMDLAEMGTFPTSAAGRPDLFEPLPRFERGTYGLRNRCSTTEL